MLETTEGSLGSPRIVLRVHFIIIAGQSIVFVVDRDPSSGPAAPFGVKSKRIFLSAELLSSSDPTDSAPTSG